MKDGMRGWVAVVLALLLVLAPAPLLADGVAPPLTEDGLGRALKYAACAGSIVILVATPQSVFFTALVCAAAFVDSN